MNPIVLIQRKLLFVCLCKEKQVTENGNDNFNTVRILKEHTLLVKEYTFSGLLKLLKIFLSPFPMHT